MLDEVILSTTKPSAPCLMPVKPGCVTRVQLMPGRSCDCIGERFFLELGVEHFDRPDGRGRTKNRREQRDQDPFRARAGEEEFEDDIEFGVEPGEHTRLRKLETCALDLFCPLTLDPGERRKACKFLAAATSNLAPATSLHLKSPKNPS